MGLTVHKEKSKKPEDAVDHWDITQIAILGAIDTAGEEAMGTKMVSGPNYSTSRLPHRMHGPHEKQKQSSVSSERRLVVLSAANAKSQM